MAIYNKHLHTIFNAQQNGKYTSDNDWCLIGRSSSRRFSICLNTFFFNPFSAFSLQLIFSKCWSLMWLCGFRLRPYWLLSLHSLVSMRHKTLSGRRRRWWWWPILYFLGNYYLHFSPTTSSLPPPTWASPRIQWGIKNDKIHSRSPSFLCTGWEVFSHTSRSSVDVTPLHIMCYILLGWKNL